MTEGRDDAETHHAFGVAPRLVDSRGQSPGARGKITVPWPHRLLCPFSRPRLRCCLRSVADEPRTAEARSMVPSTLAQRSRRQGAGALAGSRPTIFFCCSSREIQHGELRVFVSRWITLGGKDAPHARYAVYIRMYGCRCAYRAPCPPAPAGTGDWI